MNKHYAGLVMIVAGILAVASGLGLGAYNLWDDHRAGVQAAALMEDIVQYQVGAIVIPNEALKAPSDPLTGSPGEMSVLEIDGKRYIGTVSIPVLDIELPVQKSWSLSLLRSAPCRYKGSVYQGDLIICAHNYATHFGRLKNILPGDEVIFTDIEGDVFHYTVTAVETLAGTATEEMERGEWDLTLFTCTLGGQNRVTVRCDLLESDEV